MATQFPFIINCVPLPWEGACHITPYPYKYINHLYCFSIVSVIISLVMESPVYAREIHICYNEICLSLSLSHYCYNDLSFFCHISILFIQAPLHGYNMMVLEIEAVTAYTGHLDKILMAMLATLIKSDGDVP